MNDEWGTMNRNHLTPTSLRQRRAAALALWRLRAPILAFEWDAGWGLDRTVVDELFRSAVSAPDEQSDGRYRRTAAELSRAPLFDSEVDDPNVRELVQLETLVRLLAFGEALAEPAEDQGEEQGEDQVEFIVEGPRDLAHYVDQCVEASFYDHPSQDAHRQYLAALPEPVRSHGLGYFASRNLAVEHACVETLPTLSTADGLLDTPAGRDLIARCEDFGTELAATLKWLGTTGH
ncbi:hypothetical protein ACFVUN_29540 [Kitasatospora griseola]|uniref:hypothetical protein n=1 Tax=Kitasatospora griseola TaxID=2064 RepID=UPI0036DB5B0C